MTFFFISIFVLLTFWRPQEWLVPWLYGSRMLEVVTALAVASLLVEVDGGKLRFPKQSVHVYLLLGLWIASMMSHVAHTYFLGLMLTAPLVFKSCFFGVLLLTALDRQSRLQVMARIMVGMVCTMAVHALLQTHRGYGFGGEPPIFTGNDRGEFYTRSFFFGIFGDPNDMAQMLASVVPFAFVLIRRRGPMSLAIGAAIVWLLVEAIMTTHSRGGLVALGVVSILMAVLLLPQRWMPTVLVLLVLGGLAVIPYSSAHLDESARDRIAFWGDANRAFKGSPLFGVGTNMIADYVEESRSVHNAFVLCYSEIGVFGYWFWFSMVQMGFVGAWRTRVAFARPRNAEQDFLKRFAGAGIASMGGYMAASYFIGRAFVFPFFFLVATLGAIPIVARHLLPVGAPPLIRIKSDLWLCTVASLLSIVYIYSSIVLLNKVYMGG